MKSIEKDELWPRMISGMGGSLGLRVAFLILGFLVSVVLARSLGVKEFSIYTYIMSWVWLLSVFTKMGFVDLLVREVAIFHTQKNWGVLRGILLFSNRIVILLCGFVFLAFCILAFYIFPNIINVNLRNNFLIGLAILPIISLTGLRQGTLRGLNKVIIGQIPEYIVKPSGMMMCFLIVIYVRQDQIDSILTLIINFTVSLAAFVFGYVLMRKELPEKVWSVQPQFRTSQWLISGCRFLMIGGMLIINNQTDKIMLGMFGRLDDVGVYSIAAMIASFTGYSLVALNLSLSPVIVRLVQNKEIVRLQRIITDSIKIACAFSAAVSIIIIIFSVSILSLFGADFVVGRTALMVLVGAQLFNVIAGPAGTILNMIGNERFVAFTVTISALLNILLNYMLIPRFGMIGASVSTAISMIVWNVGLVVILYEKEGISSSPLFPVTYIKYKRNEG